MLKQNTKHLWHLDSSYARFLNVIQDKAIQLHKLYNAGNPSLDWISLNFDQILTSRQTVFLISKTNKTKVGLNILPNRFSILNGLIPLTWLNASMDTFKVHCKKTVPIYLE